jgi:hypothetical protein
MQFGVHDGEEHKDRRFWEDWWLGQTPISTRYPTFYNTSWMSVLRHGQLKKKICACEHMKIKSIERRPHNI